MNIRIIAALFLVATLLLVTACGSESDSPAPVGGTTERPGTTTNAPPNVPADTEAVANPAPQVEIAEPEQFFKTQNFKDDFLGIEGVIITEYTGSSKELIIPSTIGGKRVVIIGNGSNSIFRDDRVRENVESVVIPYGVFKLGDIREGAAGFHGAFENSVNLSSVFLPEGLEIIGDNTFKGCAGLTSIVFPDSVLRIGSSAFMECTGLTSVDIPDSVTSIGHLAFSGSGLTSIVIPDSVTSIGVGAFRVCTELASVIISNNVTSIEHATFYGCTSLTSVLIPDSVTSIGDSAFMRCTELTNIIIPDSVTSVGFTHIGKGVFDLCENLSDASFRGISYSYENIQELYDAINN
jgi:hypothetical protein